MSTHEADIEDVYLQTTKTAAAAAQRQTTTTAARQQKQQRTAATTQQRQQQQQQQKTLTTTEVGRLVRELMDNFGQWLRSERDTTREHSANHTTLARHSATLA
jgi:ribosome-binding protein aMBF1 (putative translation factor)